MDYLLKHEIYENKFNTTQNDVATLAALAIVFARQAMKLLNVYFFVFLHHFF